MSRQLRIEYPGAIYHVMSRGNRRERIFRDEADRRLFRAALEGTVSIVRTDTCPTRFMEISTCPFVKLEHGPKPQGLGRQGLDLLGTPMACSQVMRALPNGASIPALAR